MKVVPRGPAAFDRLHHDPRLTLNVIGRALAAMYDDLGVMQPGPGALAAMEAERVCGATAPSLPAGSPEGRSALSR